ncbi:MAG TPA: TRAP transporter small permease [Methylomirabilota bacterium]|jgi:TRAP-type C4-dicarboxylate transport system permease small subunit|nr:TRAP transporter small permease [Methylomirabilota bacterium]
MLGRIAGRLEEMVAGALLAGMAGLAMANVVTRYFVRYSLAFTEELEVAGLVWVTMLGAAIGFREGAHLGFDFVRARFPAPLQRALVVAGAGLAVATCGVLVGGGWRQIVAERRLATTSEALGLPQWIYTAAIPIGAILIAVRVIEAARRELARR